MHEEDHHGFDPQWYAREHPDVALTGLSPEEHHRWIGKLLNRRGSATKHKRFATPLRWCVITTPHTLFHANRIAHGLSRHGHVTDVVTEPPAVFDHDYYVVLCAQMFSRLPPGEKRICYQLEQSVSSRWFTSEYLSVLENSLAVWDYSLRNIEFLRTKGIAFPHVTYMPFGADGAAYKAVPLEKKYDILFYGDYKSSPRRRKFLAEVGKTHSLKLVDDVFGTDIHDIIRQSRLVLNLHYYDDALLEMARIQEVLSMGTPVLSETASDHREYEWLGDAVQFFQEGNSRDLKRKLEEMDFDALQPSVAKSVADSEVRFEFMLDRFLLSTGLMTLDEADTITVPDVFSTDMVSISLPETIERRRLFEAEAPQSCTVFDGLRRSPGWIGCGLSYKSLCAEALRRGKSELTIVEDDVLLKPGFDRKLAVIRKHLARDELQWDIFSGVIACLHEDTKVLDVEHIDGIDLVTIDRMTSMVMNIYNRWAMQLIAHWSPIDLDVDRNTIDRYLENANLRVIVAHPYIVGHREEVNSTLWNFANTAYSDMIAESERRLGQLKDEWLATKRQVPAGSIRLRTQARATG